jgi:hypothetical protein
VPSFGVVEALDVVEHLRPASLRALRVLLAVRSVLGDEKKLSIAERLIEQVTPHQALELLAGVLASAIGVMQERIGLASPPDRHHQPVGDEVRRHGGAHRPADHTPEEQVDDGSHIQPTFCRPERSCPGGARPATDATPFQHRPERSSGKPLARNNGTLRLGRSMLGHPTNHLKYFALAGDIAEYHVDLIRADGLANIS